MKKSLTGEQKSIVAHNDGHALVKAVPGSGKTTTLIKRIERLIKSGVDHRSILILMYNKSAQLSFENKLKIVLKTEPIPEVRTFHSLALKIVRNGEGQQLIKRKTLLLPTDYRYDRLVKQAYQDGLQQETSYISPSDIEDLELFIARCRAGAVTPSDAASDPAFNNIKQGYVRAYARYCELLEEYSLRTFDDCLNDASTLLRNNPDLEAQFKHIIVDEYQDVNLMQHNMVRLLAKPKTSVMAVGDINQCIYEWRGARPDFIGGLFGQHFKNTKEFHLSCTFRFGHELSLMANSVIRRNSTKLTKLCVSHPNAPKTKAQVYFNSCLSSVLPHLPAASGTQAILSRSRASLAEAEIVLRLCGLPYRYLNGASSLHSRAEIGMLVIGMSLCVYGHLQSLNHHPNKQALLYGFLREGGFNWKKGQFKEALNGLMPPQADLWAVLGALFKDSKLQKERLEKLATIRQQGGEETLAANTFNLLSWSGFLEELGSSRVTREGANDQKRALVKVGEFLKSSKIDTRTFLNLLLQPEQTSKEGEHFVLATFHGSKGLEWDSVVMIGLHEEEFPGGKLDDSYKSPSSTEELLSKEELEEERRLFYVGITRTKRQLTLVVPVDNGLNKWLRNAWDSTPKQSPTATRFVYEAGWTACALTSDAIYSDMLEKKKPSFSKFHQWYLRDLKNLRV